MSFRASQLCTGTPNAWDTPLAALNGEPWILRVGHKQLLIQPSGPRDLPGIVRMHARCSARSLLDRYRRGGQPPTVAGLDANIRRHYGVVAVTAGGAVVAVGTVAPEHGNDRASCRIGLLVVDHWQRLGIGRELLTHLAGAARVGGTRELISQPAVTHDAVRPMLAAVGPTRLVVSADGPRLHTRVPESAALGIGALRQRLAG